MVFIPRWERYRDKKPSGAVEIDWSHELSNGLVFAGVPDVGVETPVGTGLQGLVITNSTYRGTILGSTITVLEYVFDVPAWNSSSESYKDSNNGWPNSEGVMMMSPKSYGQVVFRAIKDSNSYIEASADLYDGNLQPSTSFIRTASLTQDKQVLMYSEGSGPASIDWSGYAFKDVTGGNIAYGVSLDNSANILSLRHDRVLLADEVKSLHEAPYQILKPRRRWFVFGGVSANIFNQSISLATTNSIIDSVNTDYNQSSIISSAYNIQTDKVVSANLNISLDSLQQLSNDSNALLNGTLTLTTKSGVSTSTLTSTTIDVFIDIANSYGVTPSVSVDYNPVINLNVANTTITDSIASLNLDISLNSLLNYLNEPSSQLEGILTLTSSSGITTSNTTLTTIDAFITLANIYGVVPSITIDYSTDINLSVLNSITNNTLLNYNVLTNLDLLTRLNTTYGAVSLPIEVLINLNSAYNIIKNVLVEYDGNINIDYKSSLNNNTNTDYSSNISLDLNNDISNIVNSDYNLNSQLDLHTNIVSNLSSVLDVSMLLNYSNSISDIASLSYDFNISLGINELISTLQQLEINPEVILNASFQNNNDTITNYNPSIELINNNSIVNNSITDYNTSVSLAVQNILSSTSGKDLVANISLIAQQGISTTQLITLEGSIDLGIINTYSNETLTTIDVNVDLTSAFLESLGTSVISQLDVSLDASYEVLTNGRNPNLVIRTNKGQEILVKAVNKDLKIQYIDRNIYI